MTKRFDDPITNKRIEADNKPDRSAIPTPNKATSTVPNGVKPVKLVTKPDTMRCKPSALSKLTT